MARKQDNRFVIETEKHMETEKYLPALLEMAKDWGPINGDTIPMLKRAVIEGPRDYKHKFAFVLKCEGLTNREIGVRIGLMEKAEVASDCYAYTLVTHAKKQIEAKFKDLIAIDKFGDRAIERYHFNAQIYPVLKKLGITVIDEIPKYSVQFWTERVPFNLLRPFIRKVEQQGLVFAESDVAPMPEMVADCARALRVFENLIEKGTYRQIYEAEGEFFEIAQRLHNVYFGHDEAPSYHKDMRFIPWSNQKEDIT